MNPVVARSRVAMAVKNGTLTRQPCEVCGAERVHAHHDDYNRPLDVRWLCPSHHRRLHGAQPRHSYTGPGYTTLSARIPERDYAALAALARKDERTVSALLRLAARDYLAGRTPTSREDAA